MEGGVIFDDILRVKVDNFVNDAKTHIEELQQSLECKVCNEMFSNPVILDGCGHIVCQLHTADLAEQACPICDAHFDKPIGMLTMQDNINVTLKSIHLMETHIHEMTQM